jgi:Putative mono-oxygenase ydhR
MAAGAALPSVAAMHSLFVTYALRDATPDQHAELCAQLAPAVAAVPGLHSKAWLANRETGRFGGFYLFGSRADFERFVASELYDALTTHASIGDLATSEFSIVETATALTRGPCDTNSRKETR